MYVLLAMSMLTPAANARIAASCGSRAKPCVTRSAIENASLTTIPGNFHALRNTSCNRNMLPVAGTSFMSMYALMNVATPASRAALKGGKYTLYNSDSGMNAES